MIFIFHGADSYSMKEALEELRAQVGSPDLQDANTTVLPGEEVTPARLLATCATVPFLAERRLVIVEGLLTRVQEAEWARRGRGRRDAGEPRTGAAISEEWHGLATTLADIAPTTDLVFVEGRLRGDNPLRQELASMAQVREFTPPTGPDLERWIQHQVSQRGATIGPAATRLLAELIGPDLWTQNNEVEKLALYRQGQEVRTEDVEALVSPVREANVFAAVDAVLEKRSQRALQLVSRLLESGATVPYVLGLLARQVRLVLLALEMTHGGVPQAEMGSRLGITSSYPLRKTLEQARRATPEQLRHMHGMLLETDTAIKTGQLEERLALEVLVARICHDDAQAAQRTGAA